MFALIAGDIGFCFDGERTEHDYDATVFRGHAASHRYKSYGQQEKQNQQDRIAQGVKSGSLTPGEASKLEEQQRNMGRTL